MLEDRPESSTGLTRRQVLAASACTASTALVGGIVSSKVEAGGAVPSKGRDRWLVVSAHPDDESKCSALLLKDRQPGDELILLEMRLCGEGRLFDRDSWTREEAIATRAAEMEKAAAHLKADALHWWTPPHPANVNIVKTPQTVAKMVGLLEEIRPTRIVTHWGEDSHPDHVGTAAVVDEAVKQLDRSSGLSAVYYFSTPAREKHQPNFAPNYFVEISDLTELSFVLWARAIHRSQMTFRALTQYLLHYQKHGQKKNVEFADGYVMRTLQAS